MEIKMNEINKKIAEIYEQTREKFQEWSKSEDIHIRNVACPETLRRNPEGPSVIGDRMGFSILWRRPKLEPEILFCGCCVASFGNYSANEPNLSGEMPLHNTYINAEHKFGQTIEGVFKSEYCMDLFKSCVGMNLWHFQYIGFPAYAKYDKDVRDFCEKNTINIIELLQPKRLITLHHIPKKRLELVLPDLNLPNSKFFALYHPSYQGGRSFKEEMRQLITKEF